MKTYFIVIYEKDKNEPKIKSVEKFESANSAMKRLDTLLTDEELVCLYEAELLLDQS